ncbi:helix-turn-helix domain-containing protein [Sphingomonas sp. TZW2008]|uniref:helix-turn-helix domain-containing protein n=1 Tax=Sphingomonas sp. TZW2008 TaxID=1917973 RepID=UPI000A26DAF2|nr:helix-turn-helix domain-containing protein [Sphingomonas sp. TZW2008]
MTAFTLGEATAIALGRVRAGAGQSAGRATGGTTGAVPGLAVPGLAGVRVRAPARSGAPHPTGAPIRRDSIEAGTFEAHFFVVPAKGEPDRLVRMARAALDAGRRLKRAVRAEARVLSPAEAALTAMTAGAVRVFEALCTLARLNQGRVFPTYDWLAEATALGRATVARGLRALELAGFLVRQRRFKRVGAAAGRAMDSAATGDPGGDPGIGEARSGAPRYAQTSNAYRPLAPVRLLPHLPRWMAPPPLPADAVQRAADRADAVAAMHAGLSCRELAETLVGGSLGRVLAKLGATIDRGAPQRAGCESQNDPQPLLDSKYPRRNGLGLVGRDDDA